MVGNDVVDLGDAEAARGACHPRFDQRVFGAGERRRLERADDPVRMRWILWAAKESAYKAARRCDPALVFSPRRFEVQLGADLHGRVRTPGGALGVWIELYGDCVHALAAREPWGPDTVLRGCGPIGCGDASARVRSLAIDGLAQQLGVAPSAFSIEPIGRVPQLCLRGAAIGHALSLAHHGRFAAWACALPPLATRAAAAALGGSA